jgi:Excinuclease ATPase subunit
VARPPCKTDSLPGIAKNKGEFADKVGFHKAISGDIGNISQIEMVDQNPIGKSSRSNPVNVY